MRRRPCAPRGSMMGEWAALSTRPTVVSDAVRPSAAWRRHKAIMEALAEVPVGAWRTAGSQRASRSCDDAAASCRRLGRLLRVPGCLAALERPAAALCVLEALTFVDLPPPPGAFTFQYHRPPLFTTNRYQSLSSLARWAALP